MKKQRGGWITEWVGITTDYKKFAMGLSERRAQWLRDWMKSVEERKEVTDLTQFCILGPTVGEAAPGAPLYVVLCSLGHQGPVEGALCGPGGDEVGFEEVELGPKG